MATLDEIMSELKSVHREIRKIRQKLDDPDGTKAKARSENSTFKRPMTVSEKLQAFLKIGADEQVSRADVSKRVNQYIKDNNLKNGAVIVPDAALQDVLQVPQDALATLTSLRLTKYLSPHFIKAETDGPTKPRPKVRAADA